jgi:RNA polymerase sigma factor (sigma-70 family)
MLPDSAEPTDAIAIVDIEDAVERALGSLSRSQRAVVVLRFYAHLTEAQISHVLNIPVGTVKSRLSRALARLPSNEHLVDLSGRRNR